MPLLKTVITFLLFPGVLQCTTGPAPRNIFKSTSRFRLAQSGEYNRQLSNGVTLPSGAPWDTCPSKWSRYLSTTAMESKYAAALGGQQDTRPPCFLMRFRASRDIDRHRRRICKLTDAFLHNVTVENNPEGVARLFGPPHGATLFGTVSRVLREGDDIQKYFSYFATLPNIQVYDKRYHVVHLDDRSSLNAALITWTWEGQDIPVTARMTFVYHGDELVHLHSSKVPDLNEALMAVSGKG